MRHPLKTWIIPWQWICIITPLLVCACLTLATRSQANTYYVPVQVTFQASALSNLALAWGTAPEQRVMLTPLINPKRPHTVRIKALAQHNPAAHSSEVRLLQMIDEAQQAISFNDMELSDGWHLQSTPIFTGESATSLRWKGTTSGKLTLIFATSINGGLVDVTVDGTKQRVDLYSATMGSVAIGGAKPHEQTWVGALPPVPIDHLTLVAYQPQNFSLEQLTLDTRVSHQQETILSPADMPRSEANAQEPMQFQNAMPLALNTPLNDRAQLLALWLAPSLLVTCALLCCLRVLFPAATERDIAQRTPGGKRLIAGVCLTLAAFYLLHSFIMPIVYSGGDSNSFLLKGAALAERGSYYAGSYEFLLNKLPGYPLMYVLVITLFGYNLSALVLLQHLLFCIGLWILGRAMLLYTSPLGASICVAAIALSPVQLFYSSTLLSESMMVAWSIAGLGCLLEQSAARGRRAWWWLLGCSCCIAIASTARVNGLFLGIGLVLLYRQQLYTETLRWRGALLRLVIAGTLMVLPIAAWSLHNAASWGVFAPQDLRGVQSFSAVLVGGVLEPRAASMQPYYNDFSRNAAQHGGLIWGFHSALYAHNGPTPSEQQAAIRDVDATLRGIVNESIKAHPWRYVAGVMWALQQALWLPPTTLDAANEVPNTPHSLGYPNQAQEQQMAQEVTASNPQTIYPIRSNTGWLRSMFEYWNNAYLWYDRTLVIVALLASIVYVCQKQIQPIIVVPILVFLCHLTFFGGLISPYGRYIQVHDYLLITQIALIVPQLVKRKT